MKMIKPILLTSTISLLALQVHAASVNAILTWEDVRYNDRYENGVNIGKSDAYRGYRVDTIISPDNSNWTFTFGIRQNRSNGYHKTASNSQVVQLTRQRDYQRLDFGVGYRYRFAKGWVQPSINIRQDKTININGNNDTSDFYTMDLTYNYNITDQLVWNGRFKPELVKYEYKRNLLSSASASEQAKHQRKTRFGYELEQGLRYLITPNWNVEIAYNDLRNRRDDNSQWENGTYTESNPQLRLYTTYKTSFGLTLSPYVRKSILGKIKVRDESSSTLTVEKRDLSRYAFRAQYQINNNFALLGEFYRENIKFLNNPAKQTSKQNYVRLGMRVTF